jgi:transposase-like protein
MKHPKGKYYDPEFKLRLAKEFVETDRTLEEIAQENGIDSKLLSKWTVKYRKEGEAAFFKGSQSGSFIRDPNKIPPVLYKELGLDKIRENPSELKGSFTEKEKLLLEIAEYKLQVKILKEALKKKREAE